MVAIWVFEDVESIYALKTTIYPSKIAMLAKIPWMDLNDGKPQKMKVTKTFSLLHLIVLW